jgi:hypothetical protein
MTSQHFTYVTEVAEQQYECSCPCAVYRHSVCERIVMPGGAVVVMHEGPSGRRFGSRCEPCAKASRLLADVPVPQPARQREGGRR